MDNLWLFNIFEDPGENKDFSQLFPEIALHMLKRLEHYQAGMVPMTDYPDADPLANPDLHNGIWKPWK